MTRTILDRRKARLPESFHDTENSRLPYDLGAFDLDGTVLRRNLAITPATIAALNALRERGLRLGFGGEDPVICYGGSMVRRMNGETLLHRTLPRDLGVEVLEWAAERGLHARVFV